MKESFLAFVNLRSYKRKEKPLVEAMYAYQKLREICLRSYNEDPKEGKKFIQAILRFIIHEYDRIAQAANQSGLLSQGYKKGDENLDKEQLDMERSLRGWELRRFVRENIIFDLFSTIFKYMNREIAAVSYPLSSH